MLVISSPLPAVVHVQFGLEWTIHNAPTPPDPAVFMGEEFVGRDHQLLEFHGEGARVGLK